MKRLIIVCVALCALALTAFTTLHFIHSKNKKIGPANTTGFAVVELFTSEGCSSCPPADAAVAELLDGQPDNIYVLGFHVDYWNYLGWKDIYSDAGYSQRQEQYSGIFKLNSVYTPQAIVNGKTEFTGSNKGQLNSTVQTELQQPASATISISAKSSDNKTVNVSYQLSASSSNTINIALVQLHAESNVQRGENSGKSLRHVNVVRYFKVLPASQASGAVQFAMPGGLTANDCKIIAFIQNTTTYNILGAASAGITAN